MDPFVYDPNAGRGFRSEFPFKGARPAVHRSAFLAEGSRIIGDVVIGEESSIWYNAVVRGDVHYVRIGARVNVQDNSVVHVTHHTHPVVIRDDVTIGHAAVVHGCTLWDGCLVGIHATVLDGAVVGSGAMVAAGALVPPGMEVPAGTMVRGVPARVVRELSEREQEEIREGSMRYVRYAREARESLGAQGENRSSNEPRSV